jgi:aspartate aminotransferase
MNYLADRINRLSESQTIQMAKLSRELKAKGEDIIDLSLGEPDFPTPQFIIDAAKVAMDEGYTKYTPVAGYLELRQAISAKFKRDNNLDYSPEQIVVSTGAKHAIINVVLSLVNPGEEVIIPTPYWVSYSEMVRLAQGNVVFVPSTIDTDFKITAAQLEAAITPNTKLLMFSSPCNPTGSFYSKDELKAFADVLVKYPHVHIISDEIYEHINFTGKHESIAQFPEIKNQVITVNGVSKGFSMTGWRIGYIGASLEIAKACDKMQSQFTSGTNSIAQRAAMAALNGSLEPTYEMVKAFKKRRDLVLGLLKEIPLLKTNTPPGAFYVFPDVSAYFGKSFNGNVIKDADDLCMYLIHEAKVSIVTGKAFGDDNCVRFSYATSEDILTKAIQRIKDALAKLN